MSHVFSHFHADIFFMGSAKLPWRKPPATTVSAAVRLADSCMASAQEYHSGAGQRTSGSSIHGGVASMRRPRSGSTRSISCFISQAARR